MFLAGLVPLASDLVDLLSRASAFLRSDVDRHSLGTSTPNASQTRNCEAMNEVMWLVPSG